MPRKWRAPHSLTSPDNFQNLLFQRRWNLNPSRIILLGIKRSLLPRNSILVLLNLNNWDTLIVIIRPTPLPQNPIDLVLPTRILASPSRTNSVTIHPTQMFMQTGLCSHSNLLSMGSPSTFFPHTVIIKPSTYTTLTTFSNITESDLLNHFKFYSIYFKLECMCVISGTGWCYGVPLESYLTVAFIGSLSGGWVSYLGAVDLTGEVLEDIARYAGAHCRVCGFALAVLDWVAVDLTCKLGVIPVEAIQAVAFVARRELLD